MVLSIAQGLQGVSSASSMQDLSPSLKPQGVKAMKKNGYVFHWDDDEKLKPLKHGLVDYTRQGYLLRDTDKVPCLIGYTDYSGIIEPTHLFVDDYVSDNGNHYYKETIELE